MWAANVSLMRVLVHSRDSTPWGSLFITLGCQSEKTGQIQGDVPPLLWTWDCLQWSGNHQEAFPHCCHALEWRSAAPASALEINTFIFITSGSSRMIFPVSQNAVTLHCSCLSHLRSPGGGNGLDSCSVAAHREEYCEAAHSLFSLRGCNGSYYLFCLSNCFFPLLLTSILGLMTYWWVLGLTAWNSSSGTQRSSPTLGLQAESCSGGAQTVNEFHGLPSTLLSPSSLWKSWIPSATRSWSWGGIWVSCGKMWLLLWGECGGDSPRQPPQHWGLSARHSETTSLPLIRREVKYLGY